MRRVWTVLKREYLENVRTKAFIIGLILTPLWIGIVFFVSKLVEGSTKVENVVIVDETGSLGPAITKRLQASEVPRFEVDVWSTKGFWDPDEAGVTPHDRLVRRVGAGEMSAIILTLPLLEKRAPKEGEHGARMLISGSIGDLRTSATLTEIVTAAVNAHIVAANQIDPELAALLRKPALIPEAVGKDGKQAGRTQMLMPLIFMLFLFMGIMGISQMLINSTLEEKGNRVYEVLLSSVSPMQLMAGKILGVCGVGFTLLALWAGGGLATAMATGLTDVVSASQVIWLIAFYILGFVFISSLMVAVGSACNTIKEAQNLMAPISILLAMPLILSMVIIDNPNGTFAQVLSFIPPFTPFVMMARISAVPAPPTWEIWAGFTVLLIATWIAFRLAARVFRVGVLLYGQPPSIKQIVGWMFRSTD